MRPSKRMFLIVAIGLVLLTVLLVSYHFVILELIVDYWWYSSLDYQGYFWLRSLYKYLIPGGVTLCFLFIFFSNFWIASQFIGINPNPSDNKDNLHPPSKRLIKKFQTGALEVYFPLSLIMSLMVALPFHFHWEKAILYFFAPRTGIGDPMFDFDVNFYMFSLPIYQLIQIQLFGITLFLLIAVAFLYWLEHRVFAEKLQPYPRGTKIHLSIMAILMCIYVVLGFLLDRFSLLFNNSHEPIFFGPGFVEIRYQLPLIWLSIITFLLASGALALLYFSHGKKGRKLSIVLSIVFLLILGLKNTAFIPSLVDKFIVQPNPVTTEKPFMRQNTEATLAAYALENVKTVDFEPTLAPLDNLLSWEGKKNLDNVPLWDRGLLKDVYFQLQGLRPYYSFPKVSEDRYLINDTLKQVNISAREINTSLLPQAAQNWENMHLRYTHGYGAVMTPAAQIGGQPQQWFLRDLDLHSPVGIKIKQPDIFYGMEDYSYAIAPNKLEIAGISRQVIDSTDNTSADRGGISISSLFHKLLFSIYFRDEKIFFSVNFSDDSRMMIRRNIIKRIEKLTPYLSLDSEPYLVISDGNLYWIQDAYTLSNWYPISRRSIARFRTNGQEEAISFNYIRNSVKIIINAYNGKTHFYIADPDDPIVKAYDRAYPGFFKSLTELSPGLKNHLRYPRDMFYQQMLIYKNYHQVNPELFYQQAETWEFPELESKQLKPYYLTTELPDCNNKQRFVLLTLMTPVNRDNLSAFAAADTLDAEKCDATYNPSITLYKVKKDIQLDGPVQISALIDQDPIISEQLTLWGQHGSNVMRGRMILLPVGNTVLYLQPVYLISTKTKIPELARVIVATGSEVIMQRSATDAFKRLEVKLGADPALIYPKPEKKQAKPVTEPLLEKQLIEKKEPIIKFTLSDEIAFAFGEAELNQTATQKLIEIAETIRQHDKIIVFINGYTDNKGKQSYNLRLSEARAEAVKQWLVSNQGILENIIISKGLGDANPIASNTLPDGSDNPDGRAKNRRVEIIVENSGNPTDQ